MGDAFPSPSIPSIPSVKSLFCLVEKTENSTSGGFAKIVINYLLICFAIFFQIGGGGGCLPLPVTLLPHIFGAFALKQGSPGPHSPDLCGSPWSCAPSSPLYLLGVFQKLEPHRLEVTQTPSHADDFTRWNIVNCNQNMPVKCLEYLDKCLTVG